MAMTLIQADHGSSFLPAHMQNSFLVASLLYDQEL